MIKIEYNDNSIDVKDINTRLKMESDCDELIYIYQSCLLIEMEEDD